MSRSPAHRSHPTTQHIHCPSGRETLQKHRFLGPVHRGNMHSGQLEKAGSLRKRTLSRGMSEEESLRHIIREAEESSRHLSRSDSRYGSLKRGAREESQSEDDLLSENVEMELDSEECVCVQEECVRTLSLQQEALLFQVEVLQDALEGAEEMLAETQRETHQLTLELERERAMRRKMEDKLASVTQEMERLREERTVEQMCRPAPEGSSVDRDDTPLPASGGAPVHRNTPVLHLKNIIRQSLGLVCEDHRTPEVCEDVETPEAQDENEESSGYEDAPSEFSPTADSPDVPDIPDPDEEPDRNIPARNHNNDDSCTLS